MHPEVVIEKAEFDVYAADYAALHEKSLGAFGAETDYFAKYKIRDVAREVRSDGATRNIARILDFGAGCGNSVPFFRRHFPGAALTCLDVSEESLAIGRDRYPQQADFMAPDGLAIPVEAGCFDLAFSACVFHHIDHEEHPRNLKELHRSLKENGFLFIFEHNPLNPLTVRVVNQCPFDANAHLIRAGEMKRRIERAGFSDVAIRYRLFIPPSLKVLQPLEKWLTWLPLGAQYFVMARKR